MMRDLIGLQVGNYQLVQLLGSGGFASVYLGQHVQISTQQAAIKALHLTGVNTLKFHQEAETIASLKHPHIVRLFDFVIQQGTPFLVMDYAPNGSLCTRHATGEKVPLATVVQYVTQIADALQYAHDKHIIHRDIKPDNVLLGSRGELLLGDFGIAVISQTGRITLQSPYGLAGTPYYMSPEMFRGKPDKASDQYALGVMVYQWLSGTLPFSEGDFIQLGYQHAHESATPLRDRATFLSLEVEAVVMRALAKEPHQRFATVQDFATALEHILAEQSFHVSTQSNSILPKQNLPLIVKTLIPLVKTSTKEVDTPVALPSSSTITTLGTQSDTQAQSLPSTVRGSTPEQLTPAHSVLQHKLTRRKVVIGLATTGIAAAGCGGAIWWIFVPHPLYTYRGDSQQVFTVAWSPDSKRIASGGLKTVQVWDAADGGNVSTYREHSSPVHAVAWSPDGKRIASGSWDQTVQVWNAIDGGNIYTYRGHSDHVNAAAWSPNGIQIASGSDDKTMQVWDASNGKNIYPSREHSSPVYAVAWSPNGIRIASGCETGDQTMQIWNATDGIPLFTHQAPPVLGVSDAGSGSRPEDVANNDTTSQQTSNGSYPSQVTQYPDAVLAVAWSPNSTHIASGEYNRVQVWDATNGARLFIYQGHAGRVSTVAWSPDGKHIASGSDDKTIQVWDAINGSHLFTYRGHSDNVTAIAWSPDSKRIASASWDGTVQIWQVS